MTARSSLFVGSLLVIVLTPILASASTIRYETRAEWEAALGGNFYTESFDSIPTQQILDGVGGTIETPTFDIFIPSGMVHGAGIREDASGDHWYFGDVHDAATEFNRIQYHDAVYAFAADFEHIGTSSGLYVTVFSETFQVFSGTFFGVVSDIPFLNVDIRGRIEPRFYELDNVSSTSIFIPEPSTGLLFGMGLVGMAHRRRS